MNNGIHSFAKCTRTIFGAGSRLHFPLSTRQFSDDSPPIHVARVSRSDREHCDSESDSANGAQSQHLTLAQLSPVSSASARK